MVELMKTLFLYQDPNYFHAELARAVGAHFLATPGIESMQSGPIETLSGAAKLAHYAATIPEGYDVYLCEGTYVYPAMAKRMGRLKDAKIVNILASPLLYYIKTKRLSALKSRFAIAMLDEVDAFIAVGKMQVDLLRGIVGRCEVMTTYPFVKPGLRRAMRAQPDIDSHSILFRGSKDAYYKGIDILTRAFRIVKEKWPDAELTIAGGLRDVEGASKSARGVSFTGYYKEKEVPKLTRQSALYVHMGRGDAFPMTVLESMCGGLPALVSEWTGTSEVVSRMSPRYVIPLDHMAAARQINAYFAASPEYREDLSRRARAVTARFTKDRSITGFRKAYAKMMGG